MTEPSHARPKRSLDALLAELPTPGGELTEAHLATQLERTLRLVAADNSTALNGEADDTGDTDDVLVLRTPLPLEAGEPEPADAFRFENEPDAGYDPLRAPLKSGEHAPVRLAAAPHATNFDASESVPTRLDGAAPRANARPPSWAYWLSGGVGVLAAAAACVLALRSSDRIDLDQVAARPVMAERVRQAAPSEIEPTSTELPVAALTEQEQPAEAAVAPPKAAARPSLAIAKRAPAAAKVSAGSADSPMRDEEETLVPAAGPSNLVERPSIGALNAALADGIPTAQRCLTPESPEASVRIVFQSNGSVQSIQAAAPTLSTEASVCLQRAFARARVEPFAKAQAEVTRTISLPKR